MYQSPNGPFSMGQRSGYSQRSLGPSHPQYQPPIYHNHQGEMMNDYIQIEQNHANIGTNSHYDQITHNNDTANVPSRGIGRRQLDVASSVAPTLHLKGNGIGGMNSNGTTPIYAVNINNSGVGTQLDNSQ